MRSATENTNACASDGKAAAKSKSGAMGMEPSTALMHARYPRSGVEVHDVLDKLAALDEAALSRRSMPRRHDAQLEVDDAAEQLAVGVVHGDGAGVLRLPGDLLVVQIVVALGNQDRESVAKLHRHAPTVHHEVEGVEEGDCGSAACSRSRSGRKPIGSRSCVRNAVSKDRDVADRRRGDVEAPGRGVLVQDLLGSRGVDRLRLKSRSPGRSKSVSHAHR